MTDPGVWVPSLAELDAEEAVRAACRWYGYFPETGPFRRALYQKHTAFMAAGARWRSRMILSGNRTGKSDTAAYEAVCHLTGTYPAWWTGKRFTTPVEMWAAGDTGMTTRDIIQVALLGPTSTIDSKLWCGMLPRGLVYDYSRKAGIPDAVSTIWVRHASGGVSTIDLKSYDQKREAFQGTAKHVCLAKGELVQMWDGTVKPIEDVVFGDIVLSLDGHGQPVGRRVFGVIDQGERECVRIMPKHGTPLVCTPDHEVYWGYRQANHVPARDCQAIAQPRPGTFWPSVVHDRTDAWYVWMALVIAEGTVSQKKVTNGDEGTMGKAIALLPTGASVRCKRYKNGHVPDWHLMWPAFWREVPPAWSHTKEVPAWVFTSSRRAVALFLRWLYMGDGWASGHTVGYATTSNTLARQIVILLNRLGVRATMYLRPGQRDAWREQWWVTVSRSNDIVAFAEVIGMEGKDEALHATVGNAHRRIERKRIRAQRLATHGRREYTKRMDLARLKASKIRAIAPVGLRRVYDIAVEQEHRFLAGTSLVSNCWLDEEPDQLIYGECLMRTMTTDGIVMVTMTPMRGLTPFINEWLDKSVLEVLDADGQSALVPAKAHALGKESALWTQPTTGTAELTRYTVMVTWDECPHLSEAAKAEMLAEYEPALREARRCGTPSLGSGSIYPIAESQVAVAPFAIPDHWPRSYGMDLDAGTGWTAVVWMAWDRETDTDYVYDVYKRGHAEPSTHAAAVKARGAWMSGLADAAALLVTAHDAQQCVTIYRKLGLDVHLPDKSLEAGIHKVFGRLSTGRLKVFTSCGAWFDEYRLYRRDEKGHVVKANDHALDCTRYLVNDDHRHFKTHPSVQKETPPDKMGLRGHRGGEQGWLGV